MSPYFILLSTTYMGQHPPQYGFMPSEKLKHRVHSALEKYYEIQNIP